MSATTRLESIQPLTVAEQDETFGAPDIVAIVADKGSNSNETMSAVPQPLVSTGRNRSTGTCARPDRPLEQVQQSCEAILRSGAPRPVGTVAAGPNDTPTLTHTSQLTINPVRQGLLERRQTDNALSHSDS